MNNRDTVIAIIKDVNNRIVIENLIDIMDSMQSLKLDMYKLPYVVESINLVMNELHTALGSVLMLDMGLNINTVTDKILHCTNEYTELLNLLYSTLLRIKAHLIEYNQETYESLYDTIKIVVFERFVDIQLNVLDIYNLSGQMKAN